MRVTAAAELVQARILVCVGECPGHRALQLRARHVTLKQFAAPHLEVQLVMQEVARTHGDEETVGPDYN